MFAFVALIVGAFIIYNTFTIVIAQRLREMALLRAIGATQRQVLTSVLGEAVVVGLVASAIGVGVGVLLSIGLKAAMNALGFAIPGTRVVVQPSAVIIGLLVGVGRHGAVGDHPRPSGRAHPAGCCHARRRARAPDRTRSAEGSSVESSPPWA